MEKFLVGLGLVVMASAVAFYGFVTDESGAVSTVANSGAAAAFWVFLTGTLIAILGGLTRARR